MRKLLMFLLAVFICQTVGPAAARSQEGYVAKVKVGVSVPLARHGWTGAVIWWAKDEIAHLGQKYDNVEFIFLTASSPEKQAADISELTRRQVAALVVLPVSDLPLIPALEEAHLKGIFIVAVDRTSPLLPRDVLVAADNREIGRMCGQIVAKALDGRGKIAVMEALPSTVNTERVNSFREEISRYPQLSIIDSRPVNWNPVTGQEVMEQFLSDHPQLDAVWTGDDNILVPAYKFYNRSGRKDLKVLLGLGGAKEVLKMILDDDPLVKTTINYPASIIADSIRVAVEHVAEGKNFDPVIDIKCELVDKSNVMNFYNPESVF